MKTSRAVIVQCRLSSTRLPEKAIKLLGGEPVLSYVLKSMKKVPADRYFVATDSASYEALSPICKKYDFEIFVGNLEDVLKRFCDLIKTLDVKTIIRATADNPFLFYEAAIESAEDFENRNKNKMHCDYLTWTGLPHGSGVEIFSAQSLLKAAEQTSLPYDHEHVGPALYNHSENFHCEFIKAPSRFNHPQLRTTIDTYSDFLRAVQVVNYLGMENAPYTTEQILDACSQKCVQNPCILVPSVKKGQGTGHLRRCLKAAVNNPFFVYIPENKTLDEADEIVKHYISNGLKPEQIISALPDQTYLPVYVTDAFKLTSEDLQPLSKNAGIISLDEGSEFSSSSDYLLDIIPTCNTERLVNQTEPGFIELPLNRKNAEESFKLGEKTPDSILICLGGEDPKQLTVQAFKSCAVLFKNAAITAVISQKLYNKNKDYLKDFNSSKYIFTENIPELKEKLFNYDLVLTHYGLTAFEAKAAGCKVILLPTSALHVELAKNSNFSVIEEEISEASLKKAFEKLSVQNGPDLNSESLNLGQTIKYLASGKKYLCPVCDKEPVLPDQIISRNKTRTYRRCGNCSIVYMAWSNENEKQYKKAYFFEDYKKQYGKTYQEDFESIKAAGQKRLSVISSLEFDLADKNLLDIGCAYGPFLQAASELKVNSFGTDISSEAVAYVQNELHLPATCAAFPSLDTDLEFGVQQFDIVTMWYVIEHFSNLDAVLRKVSSILKTGGIFAFSTPSGEGISCKSDLNHFYQISPTDHFTIWEPSRANQVLQKYGFEVLKIVSTGHHPERFPSAKQNNIKKGSLRWKIIENYSKAKKLGDTCEIYCRKID